jgi:hypothetical protein
MPPLYDSTSTYDDLALSFDGFGAPLANMPAVGVFIAWTDTPYTVSPAWTEISQYVRQISIRRGRQDDLQQFPPGTASLVLDNRERLFDPFNTSGANYANLKPRKQIKIVANWAGTEYPLYRGFVAGWPVEYTEAGLDSTVTIDCFDALGLMANETIPIELADYYTRTLSPRRYWKCDDSRTTGVIVDSSGTSPQINLNYQTTAIFEVSPMADGIAGKGVLLAVAAQGIRTGSNTTVNDISASFWVTWSNQASTIPTFTYELNGCIFTLFWNITSGIFRLQMFNGTNQITNDYQQPTANVPTHYVITGTANAGSTPSASLYRNGEFLSPSSTSSGAAVFVFGNESLSIERSAFQEISTYARILSVPEIVLIYNVTTGRIAESTTNRLQRLLGLTTFSSFLQSFTSTPVATVSEITPKYSVLPEMQTVAISEGGEFFVDEQGIVTFVERNYWASRTRSNTSQTTFTDSGVGIKYDADSIALDFNADLIRNSVNVEFTGGGSVNASDSTSISTYGAAQETIQTFLDSPTSAETLADLRLSIYKNPKLALEPFLSKGQQDPSYNWPRLLALELLDRVTFKRTPSVGSAVQRDLLVQSIEHRITPGEWQTVVNGSTRYTGWFILGVSLLGSTEDVLL